MPTDTRAGATARATSFSPSSSSPTGPEPVAEPLRWRGLQRWRAKRRGAFWTSCPLCGQCFGGHEWRIGGTGAPTIPAGPGESRGTPICPACTDAGRGTAAWAAYWAAEDHRG